MIERLVASCLARRQLVWVVFVLVAGYGAYSWKQLPLEAYPDISDTSAQVITMYPGHAAAEVERQVTIPIERSLNGIPGLNVMRSKSTFGLSIVTLVFRDGIEDYWARQRIRERVGSVDLPPGASADLDPLTTATGEIYRYTLESKTRGQRELSELQRWVVIPTLKQVFGVADVSNFGGETTQFQLELDPNRLLKYNLTLRQVADTVQANNENAGGSILPRGEQGAVVRGVGLIRSLKDLGSVVVTQKGGVPVYLQDLGSIRLGALQRNGILGKDDNPDAVSGIVLMLRGENPTKVLQGVYGKVRQLNGGILPHDVTIVPYLDRSTLVENTLHTVTHTVFAGMGLVFVILLLYLGSPRGALLVAITIPLSLLIAFILMNATHIPANLLSLGAIDFGILVDAAIVCYENILKRREEQPEGRLPEELVKTGAVRVARDVFFATVIIITAYLPLFAFERVEAKLFTPMAYTVAYALVGAILVALTLIPGLTLLLYAKPRPLRQVKWLESLREAYRRAMERVVRRPSVPLAAGAVAALLAAVLSATVGREFLPVLDEGSIWLQVQLPPGLTLAKADELSGELRKTCREFKEVQTIVTQLGRTDDGMDPWTFSHIEACVSLKPYGEWGGDKADLIRRMDARFRQVPGLSVSFAQPIIDMVNDKIAGAHSELVLKVYGLHFSEMRQVAGQIVKVLSRIPGAADVSVDQEPPLPQVRINVDREAAARIGINVSDISSVIEMGVGGKTLGKIYRGERVYDIAARYGEPWRNSPEAIGAILLTSATGARVPLSQVARIDIRTSESTITRESNRRHLTVKLNLRDRDLSSFLKEAREAIAASVPYDRTSIELAWGGQFENQERAQGRLAIIVPVTLLVIFGLLYATFGTVRHAAVILAVVPLSMVGGMAALHLRGMTLNVSSAVGFIALFGVAVQNGVIMVGRLNRGRSGGMDLATAVVEGASDRLRPVLMTATVATIGLLPAALARGIGSDVQRPLATVIVGGLSSATLLTLFVLPALYLVVERAAERKRAIVRGAALPAGALAALALLTGAFPAEGTMPAVATAPPGAAVRQVRLQAYLDEVLRTNLDLAASRFGVSIADAQVSLARLIPDPQLTAGIDTMDLTDQKLPTTSVVGLSQTIELGGKRRARIVEATAGRSLAEAQLEDVLQGARSNAAKAFVDALAARQVLALKRRTLQSVEKLVAATEQRLRAGDVSATALAQVRVEAERFRSEVVSAEGEVKASDAALELFVGGQAGAGTALEPVGDLQLAVRDVDPERLVATAVETRSDLIVSLRAGEVARAHVESVQAGRWIDPSLAAELKQAPSDAGNGIPANRTLGLTLSMPLPFSRLSKADLEGARAARGQAETQVQAARKRVEVEVRQALARYEAARKSVSIYAGGILANADGALDATRYSYERGAARLLEVLDAQRTVDDVYLGYAGALADRARALITLERAAAIWDVDF